MGFRIMSGLRIKQGAVIFKINCEFSKIIRKGVL